MNTAPLDQIRSSVLRWIEAVAETIARVQDSLVDARGVTLTEQPDHSFAAPTGARFALKDGALVDEAGRRAREALEGARVSMALLPERFVFRDLDLPAKASSFVDGVVRAQIDRITPWSAAQAAFGVRQQAGADDERIHVIVAASARSLIDTFVTAASSAGARSVAVTTVAPGGDAAPIEILVNQAQQTRATQILRGRLLNGLGGALAFACISGVLAMAGGAYLSSWRENIEEQVASARRTLQAGPANAGPATALHREKASAPLSTLVLEALSRALPDDVSLTALEIRGDTLRMSGLTPDASKVVGLVERSPTFSRATFAAPTVRATGEPGERFQIEAHINSVYPALK